MDCYVGFGQNPELPWTQLQWPEVYRNSVAALLLLSVSEEALPNCSAIANVSRSILFWQGVWAINVEVAGHTRSSGVRLATTDADGVIPLSDDRITILGHDA